MTTMFVDASVLFGEAKAAKAAGEHVRACDLLRQAVEIDPSHAAAERMLKLIETLPALSFTYTRVVDFLLSKGMGFNEQFVATENLIRKNDLRVGVELGVLYGYHAQHLVEACPNLFLYGVDAFKKLRLGNGYDDVTQDWFDNLCSKTRSHLEPTGRWQLVRKTTLEAAASFDRPIDFVFVDADHGYEGVRDDIEAWWRHVRPGGFVCGHDYDQPEWPGVRRAVEECLGKRGLKPTVDRGFVWWVRKPA